MNAQVRFLIRLAPAALLLPLAGCGAKADTKATTARATTEERTVPVTVAPVERRSVERTVALVGTLKGYEEVALGTKKTGRVVKVLHDMGDRVKPGEPLVELDATDAKLAVQQAEKQLVAELSKLGLKALPTGEFEPTRVPAVVESAVRRERAARELTRQRSLVARNAGTQQDLQNAETDLNAADAAFDNAVVTARATLASAQASRVALEVAQNALADMTVKAPVPSVAPPGVKPEEMEYAVAKRQAAEGQWLNVGGPVVDLVITDPLRLRVDVPERFSGQVAAGQSVRLTVPSRPAEAYKGSVTRINPTVDPVSRTFVVEATVPNRDGQLHPGGFAKAAIVTQTQSDALVVPTESVLQFAGVTKIFLVRDGRARAFEVETGEQGRGWVEVRGKGQPLPDGGQVVTTGQSQLADGTPVVVKENEPKAAPEKVAKD